MAVTDNYPAKLTDGYYRVRESWEDTASQVGAFRILKNAIAKCDDNPGTYVFDDDGNAIYPEEETEEESGIEEESGLEEDETDDTAETDDTTETGEEDTAETGTDDTDDDTETVSGTTEDNSDDDTSEEDVTADVTESDTSDTTTDDTSDESDEAATDEEFPAAEQDPVAYGRLKTLMNIRVEPSLEAEILTTYAKGTIVSILEILDTGWLKIICDAADDGYAYVSNEEGEYAYVGTSLYTVKSGDTLWKIAQEQLGSGTLYKEIRTLNGLTSNTIKVGMQLILP